MADTCNINTFLVAILAHNEEGVIYESINSVLSQCLRDKDKLKVIVVANGCTDETEKIVLEMAKRDQRVELLSIREAGKVNAVKQFIEYVKEKKDRLYFNCDRVFMMDADIKFIDNFTLTNLSDRLNEDDYLYAVGANCLPESLFNKNIDFVSILYRIQSNLQQIYTPNVLRGMLYCIKLSILERINFPENLLADDVYLECILDGHYLMDYGSKIVYKLHKSLRREIRRNLLHCIGVRQVYKLLAKGEFHRIDYNNRRDHLKPSYFNYKEILFYLLRRLRFFSLIILLIHYTYYRINIIKARKIVEIAYRDGTDLRKYWRTRK